jgi:hypothetical protein
MIGNCRISHISSTSAAIGMHSQQGVYSGNVVLGATTANRGGTLHGTTSSP